MLVILQAIPECREKLWRHVRLQFLENPFSDNRPVCVPHRPPRRGEKSGAHAGLAGSKFATEVRVFASSQTFGSEKLRKLSLALRVWNSTERVPLTRVRRMLDRRVFPAVLAVALLTTSGLVFVLASRNRQLSSEYRKLRELATLPHRGTVVPTFRTVALDGRSVIVGELVDSTARQVLFVFNTRCPFCLATIPVWEQLADSLGRLAGVEVLAISLDPADTTRQYVAQQGLRNPVLMFPKLKLKRLYRAVAVPQTVVLDWEGTVLYAKTGTLDSVSLDSVYAAATHRSDRSRL